MADQNRAQIIAARAGIPVAVVGVVLDQIDILDREVAERAGAAE